MSEPWEDNRDRPVVFQTRAEPRPRLRRRPVRVLAWITLAIAALAGAVGLAFGGSAVWSVVGPKAPANEPAPLWIPQPTRIAPPVGVIADKSSTGANAPVTPTTPVETGDNRQRGRGVPGQH